MSGAVIRGGDPRPAALWSAAGGFVGGGIHGGLKAGPLGCDLLTGKKLSLEPMPLSGPIGDVAIRGGSSTTSQELVDATVQTHNIYK